ncbi:MAG TPA: SWIM zinc finger family protein [Acidimicrobiales bacterium]|nr:SWIM zinc finger family protein [Acidimicrobiales bacterium]
MPRGWDDPWHRYPPSVPLQAEGGIATSKRRGPMATTWWSRRFTEVLESYGLGTRMQRGRRYARSGQVVSLDVAEGMIAAQVQGSRRTPYLVTVKLREPTEQQWKRIDDAIKAKVGFVARLLGGEVPPDLEEVFAAAGVSLFPAAWEDLRSTCSCPDWENPCKHIAAVLYVFADQLDVDPWLVLRLRGRSREAVLAAFGSLSVRPGADPSTDIAPWWPFAPGALPALPETERITAAAAPERPGAVLDTLEALDVAIGAASFTDLVRPVYELLVAGSSRGIQKKR